jgi:dihydroflavonol-4-reductase
MLALVTGSTGFIGSHLCRALLDAGYKVRAFHRSTSSLKLIQNLDLEHSIGDVTQPKTVSDALEGVDVVFHAASKVDYWRGPDGMFPITVGGTRNVLKAALDAGVQRVIHTSSVATLGVPAGQSTQLINETHVWNYHPEKWRYGYAKHLAEREVQTAVARGLDVVIVNPSMVLGPGDVNRISGEIVVQVNRGIVFVGIPGRMNGIHINDVVRGQLLALERGRTGQRYILGGENDSYLRFIQTTAEIVGRRSPKYTIPRWVLRPLASPLDILCRFVPMPINGDLLRFSSYNLYYDTKKAQRELGFVAQHSVREALQDTYDWYKKEGIIR